MTAQEAASFWFVRQDAQVMTPEDHDEFDYWLEASETNRRAYEQTVSMWRGIDTSLEDGESRALRVAALATPPDVKVWPKAVVAAAGVLMATVLIAVLTWQISVSWLQQQAAAPRTANEGQYVTGVRQQSTVTLPDGSRVAMNLDTNFSIDFTPQRREVHLLRGQAFFDVAKDAQRPFVVVAGDRRVEALGTKFDVRLADQRVEVVLLEGRVSVERDERSLLERIVKGTERVELRPDQRLIAVAGNTASIGAAKAANLTSWRDGWVAFEDESLERVVAELNRYSERPIVIAGEAVRRQRLSGVFRIGQPERFATLIQELLPLAVEHGEHGETVLVLKDDVHVAR